MKTLVSLTMVVAFFVAIPQCFGQSQDAENDASQLLEEQQLVQMSLLLTAPQISVGVPVSFLLKGPGGRQDTTLICHFKETRKHCGGTGGGLRTIKSDPATIARHESHGDCSSPVDDCIGHCKCDTVPEGTIFPDP